jgi:selenocysteine-specific translation elongation factor
VRTLKYKTIFPYTKDTDQCNPSICQSVLVYDSLFVTGLQDLIETLQKFAFIPKRHISSPFLFAVDHCFSVRGQGTVMTGTVLQGTVNVNDVCVMW